MKLQPHPASPPSPAEAIEIVFARLGDGRLSLDFTVIGDIDRISLPPERPPHRRDGLWRHTCFEAFVRGAGASSYLELNLSPSGQWAAYRFSGYRSGMAEAVIPPPASRRLVAGSTLDIVAAFDLGASSDLPANEPWQLNLCAVIEALDGGRSHWALAHSGEVPDFHHPDCFVAELRPAGDL
ncbi:MAG: DOMON-like domain-containing protein [Allosphingosinicella sp.]